MPRKNNRQSYPPLDLTIETPRPQRPTSGQVARTYGDIAAEQRERAERQRQARMANGIDWNVCIVPGCGNELRGTVSGYMTADLRNPSMWLPMCNEHAIIIWRQMGRWWKEPGVMDMAEALEAMHAERDKVDERESVVRCQGSEGVIYILRQNGLIKVGWSSDIHKRLKAYGPKVEILCTYPGSRQDETNLHRQLRSELAKGREWYHDGQVIELFVTDALKRYGPPSRDHLPYWTQPKEPVIKQRKRLR